MSPSLPIEDVVDEDDLIGEEFNPMTMQTPKKDPGLANNSLSKLQ